MWYKLFRGEIGEWKYNKHWLKGGIWKKDINDQPKSILNHELFSTNSNTPNYPPPPNWFNASNESSIAWKCEGRVMIISRMRGRISKVDLPQIVQIPQMCWSLSMQSPPPPTFVILDSRVDIRVETNDDADSLVGGWGCKEKRTQNKDRLAPSRGGGGIQFLLIIRYHTSHVSCTYIE